MTAVDKRFSEPDERRAITRFKTWLKGRPQNQVTINVPATAFSDSKAFNNAIVGDVQLLPAHGDVPAALEVVMPEDVIFPWLRELLLTRPQYLAEKVGIPELAGLVNFKLPKPPLPVRKILEAYREHSSAENKAKSEATKPFEELVEFAGANYLEDLTDEKLRKFRCHCIKNSTWKNTTIASYFARIRTVIRMASHELDAEQIDPILIRCKAKLHSPPNDSEDDPHPISREHFHQLLKGADQTNVEEMWRAMLLVGLNCLFYMEDVCDLEWSKIDLQKRTLISRRKKRGKCLRVATLWQETVEALEAIPRRGKSPYVFTSTHGTRYNRNTKINDFRDFCKKVGVQGVTFSHLRDGGYTAACGSLGVDVKFAELLAGHATGMKDKYVLRSPEMVRPACDAVHRLYFD